MKNSIKKELLKLKIIDKIHIKRNNSNYRLNYSSFDSDYVFYKTILNKNCLVFDIGANKGNKTDVFSLIANKVIAVDPDKSNIMKLNSRFKFNKKINIENVAVGQKSGSNMFYILDDGIEVNTMNPKWKSIIENNSNNRFHEKRLFKKSFEVKTITLVELIEKYRLPDYIKIDVEGYEWSVIQGLTTIVPLISFECNLPEFLSETISCIEYLNEISSEYLFDIAIDNKFVFNNWVDKNEVQEKLISLTIGSAEIYAKITNYSK